MRAFLWFLGALLLAGFITACIAYPAYLLTTHFAQFAFHRVTSRLAMLVLLAELAWWCRHLALTTRRDFGYDLPWRRFIAQSMLFSVVGMLTASVGAAFLLCTGLRIRDPALLLSASSWLRIVALAFSSGLAVALLEETVMRGALHTAIERQSGPWMAAMLTAPLFALLHFFAKARIPAAELGWHSGFDLLVRSFEPLTHFALILDSFLSWLVVGLILSLTRILTGNIAVAIGLHLGWVIVLRILQESTVSANAPRYAAWVAHFDGLLGFWLLPWGAAIAAGLWFSRARWVPGATA